MSGSSILTGAIPSFSKTLTGYRKVATRVGDTIQQIALRELGDAAQWYDIVALNTLRYPWIVDDPALLATGVVLAGQASLLVPSVAPRATGVAEAPDVFGTDWLLKNGQIQADAGGDIATVSGVANLAQALDMRIRTHPGDLVYHPKYGCKVYRLLGKGGTSQNDQLASSWVAAAIRADPRVAGTERLTASIAGDVLAVSGDAVSVNGKRLPVGLPVVV